MPNIRRINEEAEPMTPDDVDAFMNSMLETTRQLELLETARNLDPAFVQTLASNGETKTND